MASTHRPFGTIESAREFLLLLAEAIDESIAEVRDETSSSADAPPQDADAWRLVLYKLETLSSSIVRSGRLMDELLMLRDVLHRPIAEYAADAGWNSQVEG